MRIVSFLIARDTGAAVGTEGEGPTATRSRRRVLAVVAMAKNKIALGTPANPTTPPLMTLMVRVEQPQAPKQTDARQRPGEDQVAGAASTAGPVTTPGPREPVIETVEHQSVTRSICTLTGSDVVLIALITCTTTHLRTANSLSVGPMVTTTR